MKKGTRVIIRDSRSPYNGKRGRVIAVRESLKTEKLQPTEMVDVVFPPHDRKWIAFQKKFVEVS